MITKKTKDLLINSISDHEHHILVNRVAWALFSILTIHKKEKAQYIALPSFICHSMVIATIKAGWKIKFLDIDINTGMVPYSNYIKAIEEGCDAILFVHLLGNRNEIKDLQYTCDQKNVVLIEDAAQFYSKNDYFPGENNSKIKLISFGNTKLMDVGEGGIIFSNDEALIQEIEKYQKSYKFQSKESLNYLSQDFKSQFYLEKAKLQETSDIRSALKDLVAIYSPLLDVKLGPTESFWERLSNEFKKIDVNVDMRRTNYHRYLKYLKDTSLIPILSADSIPWRASFRIEGLSFNRQHKLSNFLREKGFDVSNWYLPAHWFIGKTEELEELLPETIKLSREIIQFWVNKKFNARHYENLYKFLTIGQSLK